VRSLGGALEHPDSARADERMKGGVLPLLAILLVAIFGLMSLAVEMTSYATQVQQARNNANLAVLAALEESMARPSTETVDQVINAALTRARGIGQLNVTMKGAAPRVANLEKSSTNSAAQADTVELRPGFWYYGQPGTSDPCNGTYPCFEPVGTTTTRKPNAYRMVGEMYIPTPLAFARAAFNVSEAKIRVDSIATVVPRRGCIVVSSAPAPMNRETHLLSPPAAANMASEMAFYLSGINGSPADNTAGSNDPVRHNDIWVSWNASQVNRSGAFDPNIHFQSDYVRSDVLVPGGIWSDTDYDSATMSERHPDPSTSTDYSVTSKPIYRIDTYPEIGNAQVDASGATYVGPEPMMTVFSGLNTIVDKFKERAVVGDQLCLIFFDQRIDWPRFFLLSDDFDYMKEVVDFESSGGTKLNPAYGFANAIKHRIFPSFDSQQDILLAVSAATTEFDRVRQLNPGMPSSDFIVLIGDGLNTCFKCTPSDSDFDWDGDGKVSSSDKTQFDGCYAGTIPFAQCGWADSNNNNRVYIDPDDQAEFTKAFNDPMNNCTAYGPSNGKNCNNTFGNYFIGMNQLKTFVQEEVAAERKIPIHVIALGANVEPHSVAIRDPLDPAKCLSDYSIRAKGLTDGVVKRQLNSNGTEMSCNADSGGGITCDNDAVNAFWNRSKVNPFYRVNRDLYDIAAMSGGLWAPLRPPDVGCSSAEQTNGKCAADGTKVSTDPFCRTKTEQITKYMEEIMGQNPFTVVQQ